MIISIYNENFEKVAETDTYKSLLACKRYNQIGAIDIQIEASVENLQLFKKNYYISLAGRKELYRINAIELNTALNKDNSLIVGAIDMVDILNQRINLYSIGTSYEGTVENYLRNLINYNFIETTTNRIIDNLELTESNGFNDEIQTNYIIENVGELVLKTCQNYQLGCEVKYINGKFILNIYKGLDHSIDQNENDRILFAQEESNLISSEYSVDATSAKNTFIPYEDTDITVNSTWIDTANSITGIKTGLGRYELGVKVKDASEIQESVKTAISKNKSKVVFEGEVFSDNYKYMTDYNVGDIVTVRNEYGVQANARIIEVAETWDNTGYSLEPIFEFEEIEEFDFGQTSLLTESNIPLATEAGLYMMPEESTVLNNKSVKVSELPTVSTVSDGCCMPIVSNGETKRVTMKVIKEQVRGTFYINDKKELVVRYE